MNYGANLGAAEANGNELEIFFDVMRGKAGHGQIGNDRQGAEIAGKARIKGESLGARGRFYLSRRGCGLDLC